MIKHATVTLLVALGASLVLCRNVPVPGSFRRLNESPAKASLSLLPLNPDFRLNAVKGGLGHVLKRRGARFQF